MKIIEIVKTLLLSSSVVAAGCAVDTADPQGGGEPVGVTRQALDGLIFDTWGGVQSSTNLTEFTNGSPNTLDLGVGAGWTCFLGGVGGAMGTGAVFVSPPGSGQADWIMSVEPPIGLAGTATAVCAPSTFLTSDNIASEGPPAATTVLLTSATVDQWCGLGAVWMGPDPASFVVTNNSNSANSAIVVGGPTWTVEAGAGAGLAFGTCAQASLTDIWAYTIVAPASGTASFDLLENDHKTPLPSGTVCFLTAVSGNFDHDSFTDGVFVSISAAGVWSATATNGKTASIMCVR
jgi:hypothetical protein